ncbi:hypothetical protein ACVW2K_000317 [Nocardioides sp. HB32]
MIRTPMWCTSRSTSEPATSRRRLAIATGRRPTWWDSLPKTSSVISVAAE